MKSNLFSPFAILSALVLLTVPALAVDTTPTLTPKPTSIRQALRELRKDSREEQKEIREQVKTTLTTERQNLKATSTQTKLEFQKKRLGTVNTGLYNSFVKRSEALKSYQERIQSRLTEKAGKIGADKLSAAQAKLDSLKPLWDTFNTDLATFKATLDKIASSSDPKSLLPDLKSQAKAVNQDLKNIRKGLIEALRLIITAK